MKKISFGLTLFLQMVTDKIKEEYIKNAGFFNKLVWRDAVTCGISIKILWFEQCKIQSCVLILKLKCGVSNNMRQRGVKMLCMGYVSQRSCTSDYEYQTASQSERSKQIYGQWWDRLLLQARSMRADDLRHSYI